MEVYKIKDGLYSLEDLKILVKYKQITKQDFTKITGYRYEKKRDAN